MQRKGIALLSVLVLLVAMSLLLLVSFSISEKYFKDEKRIKLSAQMNRIALDAKSILVNTLKNFDSPEAYDFLFSQPFIINNSNYSITFLFQPFENSLNINKMVKNGKVVNAYQDILENILMAHNVVDTSFFINLLLDTIDMDINARVYGSEIAIEEPFFRNGKVFSLEHFEKIVDYYAYARDDKNIYNIAWNKYINFDSEKIDINFVSLELLTFMFPNRSIDKSFKETYYQKYEELNVNTEEKNFLEEFNTVFSTSSVLVKILYAEGEESATIGFKYEITQGRQYDIKYFF